MLDRNMLSAGVFGRHFGLFKSVELPEAIPAATLIVLFPGVNCLNSQGAAATITGSLRQYRPRREHPATLTARQDEPAQLSIAGWSVNRVPKLADRHSQSS
jgi:hypothetical protein